jgi:hypothetical protein
MKSVKKKDFAALPLGTMYTDANGALMVKGVAGDEHLAAAALKDKPQVEREADDVLVLEASDVIHIVGRLHESILDIGMRQTDNEPPRMVCP